MSAARLSCYTSWPTVCYRCNSKENHVEVSYITGVSCWLSVTLTGLLQRSSNRAATVSVSEVKCFLCAWVDPKFDNYIDIDITKTWFLYYYRVSAADFDYLKVIGTGSFGKVQDLKDLKSHIAWYLLYTVFLELVWTQIIGLYSGVLGQTQGERYTLCSQSPTEKHYLIK